VDRSTILGRWRLAPDDLAARRRYGEHALELTPHGDLVQSTVTPGGVTRVLLTWRLDGDFLVTDQPSAPKPERVAISILPGGELMLGLGAGASRYIRDDDTFGLDPDARLFAFAGTALRHGIAEAGRGGPFTPFLMTQTKDAMDRIPIAAYDPESAERAARAQAGQLLSHVQRVAWTYEGMLTADGETSDAAFTLVSERGAFQSKTLAMRYRLGPDGAPVPYGGFLVVGQGDGWLR
jgi:hypothetical protein